MIDARTEQVFKDPAFKAKMKAQMEALRNDEAFYTWLKMMLTPEAQVPRFACGKCQAMRCRLRPSWTSAFRVLDCRASIPLKRG